MEDLIRVKDKRSGRFMVDNYILDSYGKQLGATGIAFYVTLCRYANSETQQAYPSITKIQMETGMNRTTILNAQNRAMQLKLIKVNKKVGKYTIYTLLESKKKYQSDIRPVNPTSPKKYITSPISTTPVRFRKRTNVEEGMKKTGDLINQIRQKHKFLNP